MRIIPLLFALLASAAPAVADIYMGTAFRIHELVDHPEQWADVRAYATGYYFHPRSGNEESELKGKRQQEITRLFAQQHVITERNNGSADSGDETQYDLMRDCGMTPVAGLVAEVNTLEPWLTRVGNSHFINAAGKQASIPIYADQRPWTSEWNKTPDMTIDQIDQAALTDAGLAKRIRIMTAGAGFALETDLTRSTTNGQVDTSLKHFKICAKMLEYAHAKHKRTMLFLHGFEDTDTDHYVEHNLQFIRALEDANLYPDAFIASFYSANAPLQLLPETTLVNAQRAPANTLSGLVWAVLAREGAVKLSANEKPQAIVTDAAGTAIQQMSATTADVDMTVTIRNPNASLDFAPAIVIESDDTQTNVTYAFGTDAFRPMTGDFIPLTRKDRLNALGLQTVRLKFKRNNLSAKTSMLKVILRDHAFAAGSPREELCSISFRPTQ